MLNLNSIINRKTFILLSLLMIFPYFLFSDKKIKDERRLQLGFGFIIGTHSISGMTETQRINDSIQNDCPYYYLGAIGKEREKLKDLNKNQKDGLMVAHILGGYEYGFQFRTLWRIMITEHSLSVFIFDVTRNGRTDLMFRSMIGIRAPYFIMPYFLVGYMLTYSFYPREFSIIESFRKKWAATDYFAFRPGLNIKLGVEVKIQKYMKLPKFSAGGYFEYNIKDFDEFYYMYNRYLQLGLSESSAVGKVLGSNAHFGFSVCFYIF